MNKFLSVLDGVIAFMLMVNGLVCLTSMPSMGSSLPVVAAMGGVSLLAGSRLLMRVRAMRLAAKPAVPVATPSAATV